MVAGRTQSTCLTDDWLLGSAVPCLSRHFGSNEEPITFDVTRPGRRLVDREGSKKKEEEAKLNSVVIGPNRPPDRVWQSSSYYPVCYLYSAV